MNRPDLMDDCDQRHLHNQNRLAAEEHERFHAEVLNAKELMIARLNALAPHDENRTMIEHQIAELDTMLAILEGRQEVGKVTLAQKKMDIQGLMTRVRSLLMSEGIVPKDKHTFN